MLKSNSKTTSTFSNSDKYLTGYIQKASHSREVFFMKIIFGSLISMVFVRLFYKLDLVIHYKFIIASSTFRPFPYNIFNDK